MEPEQYKHGISGMRRAFVRDVIIALLVAQCHAGNVLKLGGILVEIKED